MFRELTFWDLTFCPSLIRQQSTDIEMTYFNMLPAAAIFTSAQTAE